VGDGGGDLSLGKIAQQVNLPRSTVQRIVTALVAENFLVAGPKSGGYNIGAGVQQLAESARQDVPQSLRPVLESLSAATEETVDLAIFRNHQMVFIDQVSGKQRLRAVSAVGEIFPMTVSANGKSVLAMKQKEVVLEICQQERASGVTDQPLAELQRELEKIRKDGYSLDLDDHTAGISAVGIGFRYRHSYYAISIPAASHRFSNCQSAFVDQLLQAREFISYALPDVEFE